MFSIQRVADPKTQYDLRSFLNASIEVGDFDKSYENNNTLMHMVFGISYKWRSHENVTNVLLSFFWKCLPGSDMNAQNDQGQTPLMYLLNHEWDNTNRIDRENIESAINAAVKRSDLDITDSLGNTAVFYLLDLTLVVIEKYFPDIDWFFTNKAGNTFFELSRDPDIRWEGQKRLNRKLQDRIRVLESAQ